MEWNAIAGDQRNAIAAGLELLERIAAGIESEQNRKLLTPERTEQILGHTPMKRFGEAQELSGATILLASDAGSFITGIEMLVDGGYAAMTI